MDRRLEDGAICSQVLDTTGHTRPIWGDAPLHVDPSFSRDGKRVYANWPLDYEGAGVF